MVVMANSRWMCGFAGRCRSGSYTGDARGGIERALARSGEDASVRRSSPSDRSEDRASPLFALAPQPLRELRIHRPRSHAAGALEVRAHGFGDIDVFAIDAPHAVERWARRAPHAGRRTLLGRLEGRRRNPGTGEKRAELLFAERARELGVDGPRVEGERADAVRLAARVEGEGEESVRGLRLAV